MSEFEGWRTLWAFFDRKERKGRKGRKEKTFFFLAYFAPLAFFAIKFPSQSAQVPR
jgi:hypothetical protein